MGKFTIKNGRDRFLTELMCIWTLLWVFTAMLAGCSSTPPGNDLQPIWNPSDPGTRQIPNPISDFDRIIIKSEKDLTNR